MTCFTRLFGDLRKRKLTFKEKLSFWPEKKMAKIWLNVFENGTK